MANTLKTLTELQGDFIARKLMLMEARLKAVEEIVAKCEECRKKMCGENEPDEPIPDTPTTNPPQSGFWVAFPKSASSIVLPENDTTMYSLAMRVTNANGDTYSELDHTLRLLVGETYCWDDEYYYYSCYTNFGGGTLKVDSVLLNSGYLYEIVVKCSSNDNMYCYTGLYVTGDELIEAKSKGISVVYAHKLEELPKQEPSEEPSEPEELTATAEFERQIGFEIMAQYERKIELAIKAEFTRTIKQ